MPKCENSFRSSTHTNDENIREEAESQLGKNTEFNVRLSLVFLRGGRDAPGLIARGDDDTQQPERFGVLNRRVGLRHRPHPLFEHSTRAEHDEGATMATAVLQHIQRPDQIVLDDLSSV